VCEVCDRIREAHYNDTGYYHCRKCCATWTGLSRCHCTICHQTFNSYSASDLHWTGDGHIHPCNLTKLELREGIWYGTGSYDFGHVTSIDELSDTEESVRSVTLSIRKDGLNDVLRSVEGGPSTEASAMVTRPDAPLSLELEY